MTLLSVENLRVSYDNIKALHGLNFQIGEGEIVCIIGANGAGKSTTLRAISRMVKTEPGSRMTLQGKDLLGYSADRVVSELGVSHVPEGRRLFDNLTVTENLKLATFARRDADRIALDLKRMLTFFPAAGGAPEPEGRHHERRRAADAGRGPGLHERPPDDAPGRAVHGACPAADDEHVQGPQGNQRARAPRSSWWSRTRGWRCSSPSGAT